MLHAGRNARIRRASQARECSVAHALDESAAGESIVASNPLGVMGIRCYLHDGSPVGTVASHGLATQVGTSNLPVARHFATAEPVSLHALDLDDIASNTSKRIQNVKFEFATRVEAQGRGRS